MYLSDMISVARRFRTEECSYYPADEFGLMTNFFHKCIGRYMQ